MPRKFKKNWIERLNSEELKHLVETYMMPVVLLNIG